MVQSKLCLSYLSYPIFHVPFFLLTQNTIIATLLFFFASWLVLSYENVNNELKRLLGSSLRSKLFHALGH